MPQCTDKELIVSIIMMMNMSYNHDNNTLPYR
jgi:hypothetical protein